MNIFKPSPKIRLIDLKAIIIKKHSEIHTQNGMHVTFFDQSLYNLLKERKGDTLMKKLKFRHNIFYTYSQSLNIWHKNECLFMICFELYDPTQIKTLKRLAFQRNPF